MKILLLGKNGQVGWELQRSLAVVGDLVALDREGEANLVGDLLNVGGIERTVDLLRPDVIVNAAAYTAVDKAESNQAEAHALNTVAPQALAEVAACHGALLVHYSSDYVFDGSGDTPWTETSLTGPLSVYGKTKLAGEDAIRASGCRHIIFRTSWVYSTRGNNFARTMLRLARERDELRVVADQVGTPTGAELVADVTAHAIRAEPTDERTGTFHLAPSGETNWWEYARFLVESARANGTSIRVPNERVLPILAEAYPTPASRPRNSRLDTTKLCATFALRLPPWQVGVERVVKEGIL